MANTKQMKSFRLSDDAQFYLDATSHTLDMSNTAVVELALEWFYTCGAVTAIQTTKVRELDVTPRIFLDDSDLKYKVATLLCDKAWK